MRRLRLSTPAQALALVLPTVVLATPLALAPAYADPAQPAVSTPAAEQALENVTALLTGVTDGVAGTVDAAVSGPTDATLALLDLRKQLPNLSPEDRQAAKALMARPDGLNGTATDSHMSATWDTAERAAAKSTCDDALTYGAHPFCVHWVPAGTMNSSGKTSRHGATSASVSNTVSVMQNVWDTEITSMGYLAPLADHGREGSDQLDVYLADIAGSDAGTDGYDYFGYAVPEDNPVASSGYLVLENDFSEFANANTSSTEFREVTAAHEFFHLVQFAYDSYENSWLMESTATWMEEQVYDAINDNRNYIKLGSERQPGLSLDTHNGGAEYGTWVFHQLYTEAPGAGVVHKVWEYAAQGPTPTNTQNPYVVRDNYRWALNKALTDSGWTLERAFRAFGGASLAPQLAWSEGSAYPTAALSSSTWLSSSSRSTGTRSVKLSHLAGAAVEFKPGGTLNGSWKLGIRVDSPSTQSVAYAIVFNADGSTRRMALALNSSGNIAFSVPFTYGTVKRVDLYVGNASPTNGRTTTFSATAFH